MANNSIHERNVNKAKDPNSDSDSLELYSNCQGTGECKVCKRTTHMKWKLGTAIMFICSDCAWEI